MSVIRATPLQLAAQNVDDIDRYKAVIIFLLQNGASSFLETQRETEVSCNPELENLIQGRVSLNPSIFSCFFFVLNSHCWQSGS
jgi:hypothetical protein